ncbi:MAG: threonine/serine exporter family protein [Lachnospiraceae bacterium]|nr:threonine/serine exporter family protein [Lachnospiraceae bacterium]
MKKLMKILLDIGEAMIDSGAEVIRVEDTVSRIGYAYNIKRMDVFVITSCINITMEFPDGTTLTQVRRFRKMTSIDLSKLERINALSRAVCVNPISLDDLEGAVEMITRRKVREIKLLCGYVLGGAAFAMFFGGNLWDAVFAGMVGVLVWAFNVYLSPIFMNPVVSQFIITFLAGFSVAVATSFIPLLHQDDVTIGVIMLLVPGVAVTNAIRDILLGDTLSGILRMIEALLLAATLAIGMIFSFWLCTGFMR